MFVEIYKLLYNNFLQQTLRSLNELKKKIFHFLEYLLFMEY